MLPGEPNSARLTADMLPAIKAVVFRKVILTASGWTLFLGAMGLLSSVEHMDESAGVFGYVTLLTGLLLIGMGLYCLVKNSAAILMFDAVVVGIAGVGFIAGAILGFSVLTEREPNDRINPIFQAFVGLVQIIWATRQFARHSRIERMGQRTAAITAEQRKAMKADLQAFVRQDEDFETSLLRMSITERATLSVGHTHGFRGQLLPDQAILVAKLLNDCHCIDRDVARGFTYKSNGRALAKLADGKVQIRFAPISAVSWKLWAGVELRPDDLRSATKARKLSPELVMAILRQAGPESRALAVAAIPVIRRLDGAKPTDLLSEALDDEAANVRTAAIGACASLAIDDLRERLLPMLKDSQAEIRRATAAYLCACPSAEALGPLDQAAATEQDPSVRKQIARATAKCRKLVANPYAQTR